MSAAAGDSRVDPEASLCEEVSEAFHVNIAPPISRARAYSVYHSVIHL